MGTGILLVEQNVARALALVQRAYVLDSGEVTLHGTSAELVRNEQVQAAYLGIVEPKDANQVWRHARHRRARSRVKSGIGTEPTIHTESAVRSGFDGKPDLSLVGGPSSDRAPTSAECL